MSFGERAGTVIQLSYIWNPSAKDWRRSTISGVVKPMEIALNCALMLPSLMSIAWPSSTAAGILSLNISIIRIMPSFHASPKSANGLPVVWLIGTNGLWKMSCEFTPAPSSMKTLSTKRPSKTSGGTVALSQLGFGP